MAPRKTPAKQPEQAREATTEERVEAAYAVLREAGIKVVIDPPGEDHRNPEGGAVVRWLDNNGFHREATRVRDVLKLG